MAKKTSRNAVKKIDNQINTIASSNRSRTRKNSTTKVNPVVKDKSNSFVETRNKINNTRDTVIIPSEKKAPVKKKTTTSKKNVRGEVIVAPQKNSKSSTKKSSTSRNVRSEVVVVPTKAKSSSTSSSKKTTKKTSNSKTNIKKNDNVVDVVRLDYNVESIINDIEQKEKDTITEEFVIDDFESTEQKERIFEEIKESINNKKDEVTVIKSNSKKKLNEKEFEELKLDKPIDLDNFDQVDNYKIINEFEEDIYKDREKESLRKIKKDKKPFTLFKKSRKYIADAPKNSSYHELENDLRSLYDKVNDVVSDFDYDDKTTSVRTVIDKSISKKNTSVKKVIDKKLPIENKVEDKTEIKEFSIEHDVKPERKILLDYINQKVLNFFLIFLLIVFTGMTIAFIWFLIYVSTF